MSLGTIAERSTRQMIGQVYDWKRLWYPRGANVDLSPMGYLYYSDSIPASLFNSVVVPFESIADTPCLVLLGEPGIGKSYAMQMERNAVDTKVGESGGKTLWLDLHSYGDEDRLVRALFENQAFTDWLEGEHKLHLFLDSLDECLLRVNTVAELLGDELAKYPVERLCLRIACRTADWPISLENNLEHLWGQDAVGVYELAPLQREDIAKAARANDLSPDVFLAEVDRMDVAPLAIKPVTLEFLLNTYKRCGQFPSTQTELYQDGCRRLCGETNEDRRGARLTGAFTADERMAVAARIAAVTVFANKAAIWTGMDRGDVPEDDVIVRVLTGGNEPVVSNHLQVTEAVIRETLATGLFSSRGPKRMGWAHQTYAEFLAARYLAEHNVTLPQTMSLIAAPSDYERKVVPQLQETAAWLTGMLPDVFNRIVSSDPLVLLRSDAATVDERDRESLVSELLKLYDEEKLLDHSLEVRRYYDRLAHSSLAEQLRPYIVDATKGVLVRRVATDIAEACELGTLQDEIAQMALDHSQPYPVRVHNAWALYRIGDDTAKKKLKPLAMVQAGPDPDDELKGCGLLATWPDHITAEELFAVLTLPKRQNLFGSYSSFLSSNFVRYLRPSDLPVALRWVKQQSSHHKLSLSFSTLLDTIILKAWENLNVPDVLTALAKTTLSRLRRFAGIVSPHLRQSQLTERLREDDHKRHLLVETIVPMFSDAEKEPPLLVYSQFPLVTGRDLLWMLDRFQEAESEQIRAVWERLISMVFYRCEPDQVDNVFAVVESVPVLSEAFGKFFEPIDLNSPLAQTTREHALARKEKKEQFKSRYSLEPPPGQRISKLLDECESEDPTAWWQLNLAMGFHEDGRPYLEKLDPDLTVLPGWESADDETRARIVETARQYVLHGEPETPTWLGTNTIYRPALAGYRALLLLLQHDAEFVLALPAKEWRKWAPIILAYPRVFEQDNRRQDLITLAYCHAPGKIIETLATLIDKRDREDSPISVIRDIEICWDDRLANALLEKAKNETLKPQSVEQLLDHLLEHQSEETRLFAESLVPLPLPSGGKEREMAIVAARTLVRHAIDAGWHVVWPAIQQDAEFGREVVLNLTSGLERYEAVIVQRLSESQLADLYIWLTQQFPHTEDPQHKGKGFHFIGPREDIAGWRDSLLRHLAEQGTPAACEAIRRIAQELPKVTWMGRVLLQAQDMVRRKTWSPPQPQDILKIAADQQARLVNSGDELVQVLVDSLRRLEVELQGETPAVREIWDQVAENTYRPVDENVFSDYVKRYLERDLNQRGVVVNREVQIRRGTGGDPGERTDIHANAIVPASGSAEYDVITVIIEAKGCWHSELETAMETQLVNRYLRDNQCRHGIYLVGWFDCEQWDDDDSRKGKTPKKNIAGMQARLDSQAADQSKRGVHIRAFVMNTALR